MQMLIRFLASTAHKTDIRQLISSHSLVAIFCAFGILWTLHTQTKITFIAEFCPKIIHALLFQPVSPASYSASSGKYWGCRRFAISCFVLLANNSFSLDRLFTSIVPTSASRCPWAVKKKRNEKKNTSMK